MGEISLRDLRMKTSRCFPKSGADLPQVKCLTVPSNIDPLAGVVKHPCGPTISYELERDMKLQMHKKFCDMWWGPRFTRQPRESMMLKEYQCIKVKRGKFPGWCSQYLSDKDRYA